MYLHFTEFHDAEGLDILDTLETQTHAVRKAREVPDELPVNDYVSTLGPKANRQAQTFKRNIHDFFPHINCSLTGLLSNLKKKSVKTPGHPICSIYLIKPRQLSP